MLGPAQLSRTGNVRSVLDRGEHAAESARSQLSRAHVIPESGDADQQAFPRWQLDRLAACRARVLALLVYAGIAVPALWSASPARRKAAADTLPAPKILSPNATWEY